MSGVWRQKRKRRPTTKVAKQATKVAPPAPVPLERLHELERLKVPLAWIPEPTEPGVGYIPGHGYRVAIVYAGDDGYRWTGDWPYDVSRGDVLPWFYGHDLAMARKTCDDLNLQRAKVTPAEAHFLIARSMHRANGGTPP